LVIQICPTVAEKIVQLVPNRRGSSLHDIDVRVEDRVLVRASDATDRPAVGPCDQGIAHKARATLGSNPVCGRYEDVVGMRSSHCEIGRHACPARVVQRGRRPDPTGRDTDEVGTLLGDNPRSLGKPDIPAHQKADPAELGFKHRVTEIARREEQLFLVPQMGLPVLSDKSVGSHENCRIEELDAVQFWQATDDVDVVFLRECLPYLYCAAGGNPFRVRISFGMFSRFRFPGADQAENRSFEL
jgi:hypothetical protein